MEYTHLRFEFRGGAAVHEFPAERVITIDCPNEHGGVGNITLHGCSSFYAGQWFSCIDFKTQLSNLVAVYRVSLNEEIAPKLVWKVSDIPFSYEYWKRVAKSLNKELS